MKAEEHRQRMCDRKIRYHSRLRAQNAIKSIRRSRIMDHEPKIYECPYCFGFHIAKKKYD